MLSCAELDKHLTNRTTQKQTGETLGRMRRMDEIMECYSFPDFHSKPNHTASSPLFFHAPFPLVSTSARLMYLRPVPREGWEQTRHMFLPFLVQTNKKSNGMGNE